jgi:hypothetical protein
MNSEVVFQQLATTLRKILESEVGFIPEMDPELMKIYLKTYVKPIVNNPTELEKQAKQLAPAHFDKVSDYTKSKVCSYLSAMCDLLA